MRYLYVFLSVCILTYVMFVGSVAGPNYFNWETGVKGLHLFLSMILTLCVIILGREK